MGGGSWCHGTMDLDDLVKGLLSELNRISKSDAVTGEVREVGNARMLPLSRITLAFGSAATSGKGEAAKDRPASDAGLEAGGVVGAVQVQPRAFVVVDNDGQPHMLALGSGKQAVLRRGLELAASAADKFVSPEDAPALTEGSEGE